jgi:hypothetical protein
LKAQNLMLKNQYVKQIIISHQYGPASEVREIGNLEQLTIISRDPHPPA